tara:strand:+ start:869 stop:1114 length:246 start_codon:yes stop_codon:yes gene_type:complete
MNILTNRFVRICGEGAGLYWIDVLDALRCIPENANGRSYEADTTYDTDGAHEITAPESQDFLDQINEGLDTSFKLEDFDGR